PIIANFIRKEENDGEVPLHQNWAFVDERRFTSVSIWVPLMDSNVANGTLEMVDGSHKRFGELRGPLIPWELDKVGRDIIADFMTPMNVNAGDAVVLDDSLVHYSNINQTDGLRLTIQLILVPKEVEVLHYHLDQKVDEHKVNVLGVDRDFFMKFHPWAKPHGRDLGSRKFRKRYLSRAEFEKRLLAPRFDEKPKGFLGKIKSIFR
ncbi:MAG TPA: hypothetical protein ENJ82_11470, partial [Bacteroidetes bacterium]|nr:hypothetical protein [Bacteroidota bacterium]